jgi:hypothetical protein
VGKLRSRIATVAAAALSIPATVKAKASQK